MSAQTAAGASGRSRRRLASKLVLGSMIAAFGGIAGQGAATADDAPVSFKDKPFTMFVGTTPGGGYDTFTRTIAPHFRRHLPGEPNIIVRNMPGAGSSTLMSHLYNLAARDGSEIGGVNPDVVTEPLMMPKRVNYDSTKMTWIGSALRETNLTVAWHTSPIKSFDEIFQQELVVAGSGGGSDALPVFVNALLGTKFKLIRGYPGLKAGMLALERGEVAGTGSITWASLKATNGEWLRDGKIRILVQYGLERHSELPEVPSIYQYARNDDDRAAMNLVFGRQEYGRPYVAPAVPAAVASVLRRAFDATMTDPAFLKDAQNRRLDIDPITGERMDQIIGDIYKTPPAVLARVKAILGEGD